MNPVPKRISYIDHKISLGDCLQADMSDVATIHESFIKLLEGQSKINRYDFVGLFGTSHESVRGGCLRLAMMMSIHIERQLKSFEDATFSYDHLDFIESMKPEQCLPLSVWERLTAQDVFNVSEAFEAPDWLGQHITDWLQALYLDNPAGIELHEGFAPT